MENKSFNLGFLCGQEDRKQGKEYISDILAAWNALYKRAETNLLRFAEGYIQGSEMDHAQIAIEMKRIFTFLETPFNSCEMYGKTKEEYKNDITKIKW